MIGILVGLLVGVGLAVAVEMMEDRVRNEDEVTRIVNVRILAAIPHLFTPEEQKKQRRQRVIEWSCAGLMLAGMVAANAFTSLRR